MAKEAEGVNAADVVRPLGNNVVATQGAHVLFEGLV